MNITAQRRCRKCERRYVDDEDDDGFETGLCYECFETGLEDYEENRRRKIAERNEY
jgi:hypothetical protein